MVIKLDNRLGPDLTPKPAAAHKHQHRSTETIPTGPLYGLPKRVKTDRKRAIDRDQITNIVNAFAFSEHQRLALNGGLVVTWRASHLFDGDNWAQLQTQLLDSASRFLYRQGVTTAFIWTRERATGHGAHTHIMIHLSREPKIVCSKLRDYLRQRLQIEPSGLYISHGRYGMLNPQMRAGQLLYNLKGFDPQDFRYTGIGAETENIGEALGIRDQGSQGIIDVKRCGTSQNLGPAARRKAGWHEVRDTTGLYRILHPDKAADSDHGDLLI